MEFGWGLNFQHGDLVREEREREREEDSIFSDNFPSCCQSVVDRAPLPHQCVFCVAPSTHLYDIRTELCLQNHYHYHQEMMDAWQCGGWSKVPPWWCDVVLVAGVLGYSFSDVENNEMLFGSAVFMRISRDSEGGEDRTPTPPSHKRAEATTYHHYSYSYFLFGGFVPHSKEGDHAHLTIGTNELGRAFTQAIIIRKFDWPVYQ